MARFSIGTAIGESFGLIGRRPLSVFVWGALMVLPSVGTMLLVLPMLGEIIASGGEGFDSDFGRAMQFQGFSGLLNIVQLLVMALVYTAVMRAIVRAKETAFFSLRIGMDELRVTVVGIAVFVGFYLAMIVLVMLGAAIGYAIWQLDAPGSWIALAALALVLIIAIWLMVARISLIAPASVLLRDFAFVQGWRLGRGQTWPLFGMMLVLTAMVLVIELLLLMVGITAFGLGANFANIETIEAWADPGNWGDPIPWLMANWVWCAVGSVVLSFVYGALMVLGIAPFASACRQLADSSPAAVVSRPDADEPVAPEQAHEPEL